VLPSCYHTAYTYTKITDQTYTIKSSTITTSFISWVGSVGGCPTTVYSATLENGSPLDTSVINFDSINRIFTIQSNDLGKIGIYKIKVTGTMTIYKSESYIFTLSVVCNVNTMTLSFTVADYEYYVGS
jgi:hypothetical protein